MFITFHLSIYFVVDLRSDVYGTPPWIWFAWYSARFPRMFWKITVWTQSATDDPGFCSSFHKTSDCPPWKGYFPLLSVYREYVEGSQSSRMLMCMWGNVCSLCVRGLSRRRY